MSSKKAKKFLFSQKSKKLLTRAAVGGKIFGKVKQSVCPLSPQDTVPKGRYSVSAGISGGLVSAGSVAVRFFVDAAFIPFYVGGAFP